VVTFDIAKPVSSRPYSTKQVASKHAVGTPSLATPVILITPDSITDVTIWIFWCN